MTGAYVVAKASRMVSADTCDRSTIMPKRFISLTTLRPKDDSPLLLG